MRALYLSIVVLMDYLLWTLIIYWIYGLHIKHIVHTQPGGWRGASDTVYKYNYDCVPCFHVEAEGGRYSRETGGFHQG